MLSLKVLRQCIKINSVEKYYEFVKELKILPITHLSEYKTYKKIMPSEMVLTKEFIDKSFVGDKTLAEKFNLIAIAGEGDTFSKALKLMQWLTDNTYYCGMAYKGIYDDSHKILKHALNNEFKYAINCRLKAIAFTDMLLSIGIIALPIVMQGTAKNVESGKIEGGCHFMVHIYLKETKNWIVFDPSFNTYFQKENKILNISELRKCLCNGEFPTIIGYNFNGSNSECLNEYKEQFVKLCLEFLFTWATNKRKKRITQGFSCSFDYILEPDGDSWYDKQVAIGGAKYANKFCKKLVYIDENYFLNIAE